MKKKKKKKENNNNDNDNNNNITSSGNNNNNKNNNNDDRHMDPGETPLYGGRGAIRTSSGVNKAALLLPPRVFSFKRSTAGTPSVA